MIDLNEMKRGMDYKELPNSIIIFICTFDPFEKNEPIYTFTKRCIENPEVFLNDGSKTVFVNSKEDLSKASPEVGSFLTYLEKHEHTDDLTESIDQAIQSIRDQHEWRLEYMTLLERDAINRAEGRVEGRAEGRVEGITEGITLGENKKAESVKKAIQELLESKQIPAEFAPLLLSVAQA